MKQLLLVLALAAFVSCKKGNEMGGAGYPPPPPPATGVLLKNIEVTNLPSPYYHFEYNNEGKIVFASFASDLTRYDVSYNNKGRISEMRNNILVNKDRLKYYYDEDGKVLLITYADSLGNVYKAVDFGYNGDKLIGLSHAVKVDNSFVDERIITMSYYPDGNLSAITYHYLPFNGQQEVTFTNHFEQYDDKVNVSSFSLLHDGFFEHFFLLPGVQLQKNNPQKETRTGNAENYTITYNYNYNDKNVPVHREGQLLYTSGPKTGQRFTTTEFYSYY